MKYSKHLRIAALLLLVVGLATSAQAGSTEAARKWFDKLAANMAEGKAFKSDFNMSMNGSAYGQQENGNVSGTMLFMDETHMRMTMEGTMAMPTGETDVKMAMVSDGTHTYIDTEIPMMGRQVIKMPVNFENPMGGGGGMGGKDPLVEIREMADKFAFDVIEETDEQVVLRAPVDGQDGIPAEAKHVTLTFDKKTGFPRRMTMGEPAMVDMQFTGFQEMPNLSASDFTFTPPEGVQVMDLSAMMGG